MDLGVSLQFPKFRNLQPRIYQHNGTRKILLEDPLRLKDEVLLLPASLAPLLMLCDGSRDIESIRRILQMHFEVSIENAELLQFIKGFDNMLLLENLNAEEARRSALEQYRSLPYRAILSAGNSYPADPVDLHAWLQDMLEASEVNPDPDPGCGLLSPHIDYQRGGDIYAGAWKRAARMIADADLFLLLGTDHHNGRHPISLTRQHYATPFGILPTDQPVVDRIANRLGEAVFAGELFHRGEHSLELILVWLSHLLGDRRVPVVPVLVGQLPPSAAGEAGHPEVAGEIVEAFQEAFAGRQVFTIISGDLAHVGPAFDGDPVDDPARATIRAADENLLRLLSMGAGDEFLHKIEGDGNIHNICGVYPAYLGMRWMGSVHGEITGYSQCPADDQDASLVSVGGMVFKRR